MTSIQRRISVGLTAAILVAGIVAATASFVLALDDATESQDARLDQVAAALSRQSVDELPADHQPRDLEDAETRFVIAPLGAAPGTTNPAVNIAWPESLHDGLQTRHAGERDWRVMVGRDRDGRRFAVAQTVDARDEEAVHSALFVLIPLALMIPVLLIVVHVVLRRAFAPIAALSREADAVDGSRLETLSETDVPAELGAFVQAVNRLLRRLGVSLDQQRRLVADAAHELRSPVAALTVQADNVARVAHEPEVRARIATLQGGLRRMAHLLEQLLGLARIQGTASSLRENLPVDRVVRAVVEDLLPLAVAKGVDLGCTRLDAVTVRGVGSDLQALLRNAVDNAVRYTPAGGRVDIALRHEDGAAVVEIDDTGPGIVEAEIERLFDPFVRAAGTKECGSGLGLAIARGAAEALGGTIVLANRKPGPGLRFTYRQAITPETSA